MTSEPIKPVKDTQVKDSSMPVQVFSCYSPRDKKLLLNLEEHLSPLKRSEKIAVWTLSEIKAGMDWTKELESHLNAADVILLLVSPSFISSTFCYSTLVQRALERHQEGNAKVIPIILRPTFWQITPIGKLECLPKGCKPITQWSNRDMAFLDVVIEIWNIIVDILREKGEEVNRLGENIVRSIDPYYWAPSAEDVREQEDGYSKYIVERYDKLASLTRERQTLVTEIKGILLKKA